MLTGPDLHVFCEMKIHMEAHSDLCEVGVGGVRNSQSLLQV